MNKNNYDFFKIFKSGSKYKYLVVHPIQSERYVELCKKKKKLPEDKAIIIKTMEATTPELGPVGFWSPKSSFFSGSDSIVVEEAARNFQSPRPSINKLGTPNFFNDKVEASKLRRYLETCGRALEQFLQLQTSSNDSIVFLLSMPFNRLVRG